MEKEDDEDSDTTGSGSGGSGGIGGSRSGGSGSSCCSFGIILTGSTDSCWMESDAMLLSSSWTMMINFFIKIVLCIFFYIFFFLYFKPRRNILLRYAYSLGVRVDRLSLSIAFMAHCMSCRPRIINKRAE